MATKTFTYRIDIESSATTKDLAQLELQLNEVNKAIREAKKEGDGETYEKLRREQLSLQDASKELRKEIREQTKAFREQKFPEDSLIGLRKQYRELRKEINALSQEERESDFGRALIDKAKGINDSIKEIAGSVGDFRDNVGNYRDALSEFQGLDTGSLIAGLFDGSTAKGVNDIVSSLNPYAVAASAAVAGTVALAREIIRVTEEYTKLNAEVSRLTGLEGFELQSATVGVKALADTFDQDFNEVLLAANTLTKELTGDFDQSIEIIKTGFIAGANASGQFLDNIREYSTQLRASGADAEQFLEILIRSEQEGIFSDKGVDTIKEFGLRIREQTDATRSALENAFGEQFTQQLFDGINDGSITTVNALTKVSEGLKDNQINAQQAGQLLADVFGGPGEDAGLRFIEILGEVDGDLTDLVDITDTYTRRQLEAFDATRDLANEQQILASQFDGVGFSVETATTKLRAFGTRLLNETILEFRSFGKVVREEGLFKALTTDTDEFGSEGRIGAELLREDAKVNAELEEKKREEEKKTADQRRELALQGKLDLQGLRQEQALIKQEIIETKIAGEDYSGLQRDLVTITNQLASATNLVSTNFSRVRDNAEPAATSIRGIKDDISEIRKQLELSPDASTYSQYYQQLLTKEKELAAAITKRNRAIAGDRPDIGVTPTLGAAAGLPTQVQSESGEDQTQLAAFGLIEELKTQKLAEESQKRIEIAKKEEEEKLDRVKRLGQATGELLIGFASGQEDAFKEFGKSIITLGLEILEKQVLLSIASAQAQSLTQTDSIATFGATGIARGAILTALIKGVFSGVKSAIQSFAEGGQVLPDYSNTGVVPNRQNTKRQRNGDRVLAYLTPGEVVLNKAQQQKAVRMYGTDIFAQLGIPGFADGGIVPNTPQLINPVTVQSGNVSLNANDLQTQAALIAQQTAAATQQAIARGIQEAEQRRERREELERSRRF
jgi:hypothetical protein